MTETSARDIGAFVVGTALGGLGTFLVFAMPWFAGAGMFLLCALLFPLFASLVSERRTILAGLIPNVVMMLCIAAYFLVFFRKRDSWWDALYALVVMLLVGFLLALLVSVPITLIRRKTRKNETINHIFSE
jgi:Na+/proline symporter